jgi:hypothetical protein
MPTPAEHLDLAYPGLAEAAGAHAAAWALEVAADYRPSCLSAIRQDLAQAYYAAHLLMSRQPTTGSTGSVAQRPSVILEEKEGDNSIKYADPNAGAGLQASAYDNWKRLADICGARGMIITRFGL